MIGGRMTDHDEGEGADSNCLASWLNPLVTPPMESTTAIRTKEVTPMIRNIISHLIRKGSP
jgi:hypothetical protein